MRQWRANDTKLNTSAYIRMAFSTAVERHSTRSFLCLVFVGAGGDFSPWFVGFTSRGVDVGDMLARGAEGFVEDGGDEE